MQEAVGVSLGKCKLQIETIATDKNDKHICSVVR